MLVLMAPVMPPVIIWRIAPFMAGNFAVMPEVLSDCAAANPPLPTRTPAASAATGDAEPLGAPK